MPPSIFSENIPTHAARCGLNTRNTKIYRSLAAKHWAGLSVHADRNTSAYIADTPLEEIERLLFVQGKCANSQI